MSRRDVAFIAVGFVCSALGFLGLQLGGVVPAPVRGLRGKPTGGPAAAESQARAASAPSAAATISDDEAWRTANANLAETVRRTQQLLDKNEAEKKTLAKELRAAKERLAASEGDGAAARDPYDLTPDDWKDLAKEGSVRARYPCVFDAGWQVRPETAEALGLAPTDAPAIEAAFKREEGRIWSAVQPACAKILGNPELAQRLGPPVCIAVLMHSTKDQKPDLQLVADVRAGNKPMPAAWELDPFATLLLAETGAMPALQDDLAKTFGPDVAHRVAFADELGSCSGSWGSSSSSPPPKPR
jgi:hypothetical protein